MAIKGADGNEVEDCKDDVDIDKGKQESGNTRIKKSTTNNGKDSGDKYVTYWSGDGYEGSIATRRFKVGRIKLDRFSPAKTNQEKG